MGKASTNAGIHPYLKPDFQSPLKVKEQSNGIPFTNKPIKFMNSAVKTEYKDVKKNDLYFKDEVEYEGLTYEINYDSLNFKWIIVRDKKIHCLRDVTKKLVLKKKCEARMVI